jgi:hypothetical protein
MMHYCVEFTSNFGGVQKVLRNGALEWAGYYIESWVLPENPEYFFPARV